MSIEEALAQLQSGAYPAQDATPLSDQAFAVLKSEQPFPDKLNAVRQLAALAQKAGGEDAARFGWVFECMMADATAEQISLMHQDAD
ncbi:hypothetical protein [Rheinheimera sp.]|uniref:hypothetical protein n=1 Tax=Rheinheimera sp. TaxID=1869214 RepID=UPI00307DFF64